MKPDSNPKQFKVEILHMNFPFSTTFHFRSNFPLAQSSLTQWALPYTCPTATRTLPGDTISVWLIFIMTDFFYNTFRPLDQYLFWKLSEWHEDVILGFAKHGLYALPLCALTFLGQVWLNTISTEGEETAALMLYCQQV